MSPRDATSHDRRAYGGPDRRSHESPDPVQPVVLIRKLADAIDGVDLKGHEVGDRLPLSPRDALILIAEGWAKPTRLDERRRRPDEVRTPSQSRHERIA